MCEIITFVKILNGKPYESVANICFRFKFEQFSALLSVDKRALGMQFVSDTKRS